MLSFRTLVAVLIGWSSISLLANSCPFCTAVSQTMRQEFSQTDVIVFASFVSAESDSVSTFEVAKVLKGDVLASTGQKISVSFFGQGLQDQLYMISGVGPGEVLWSPPIRVNETVQVYVDQVLKLPKDDSKARLRFFTKHLAETDPIIARDVFDEFASASYAEMVELKDSYDREQLLKWIQDSTVTLERRKLYLVMLGICGKGEDADILEAMLTSEDQTKRAGLDALIACYITLKGESGLKLIEDLYLNNPKASYMDVYSAIMAIRFHGTDGKIVDPKILAKTFHPMLKKPKLADLVIPDLSRWEDWSQVEQVVQLFKDSEKNEATWVRLPVFKYLQACPLDEAQAALKELKELDPATFRRATMFFPDSDDSSHLQKSTIPAPNGSWYPEPIKSGLAYAALSTEIRPSASAEATEQVNLATVASVIGLFSATIWIGMWLTITGTGRGPEWLLAMFCRSRKPT